MLTHLCSEVIRLVNACSTTDLAMKSPLFRKHFSISTITSVNSTNECYQTLECEKLTRFSYEWIKKNKEGWCIFIRSILQSYFHVKKLQISNRFRTLLFSSLCFQTTITTKFNDVYSLQMIGFAFHSDAATFYKIIEEDFSERSICELSEIQLFPEQHMMAIVQKGSPLRKMITYGWVFYLVFFPIRFFFVRSLHTSYM